MYVYSIFILLSTLNKLDGVLLGKCTNGAENAFIFDENDKSVINEGLK